MSYEIIKELVYLYQKEHELTDEQLKCIYLVDFLVWIREHEVRILKMGVING